MSVRCDIPFATTTRHWILSVAFTLLVACAFAGLEVVRADEPIRLSSPDGRLQVTVSIDSEAGLRYSLEADGRRLIAASAMGLDFGDAGRVPSAEWRITRRTPRQVDEVWKPVWGKRAIVPDRFQEMVIALEGPGSASGSFEVVMRAYDDGMAFRYRNPTVNGHPLCRGELSSFEFAGDYTAWFYNGENHNLGPEPLSSVTGVRLPVMTVRAADQAYLAIHEADLRTGEPLRLAKTGPTAFTALAARGPIESGFESPWRVILFGRSPGALVDSHLLELLSPPAEGDFSWVKPGMAVWDWRIDGAEVDGFRYEMSLPSWIRMVDFAAANGMKYLVLDANWYGPEFEHGSDPVQGDKAADVRKLIAYGKSKGVGIWLYLNDIGGRQFPLERTLAEYSRWGAQGVKYGFMRGTPEEKNALTRKITGLCARHRLLCDFHDHPVHPHGQMRTWPNAVTREYNQAQLDAKKVFGPKTFVTAVFVNMIAGPLDMNNGMFDLRQGPTTRVDNNMEVPSTVVSEAARTLITFSGVTILPDIPEFYQKYPDLLEFLAAQKMPWRESRTLSGVIGEHIIMARQAADGVWLIGAATDESPRELEIRLDFLPPGPFDALLIEDGKDAHYLKNREMVQVRRSKVSASDLIKVRLAAGGGACAILRPASP